MAQEAWKALKDTPSIFAYGIGFGEDSEYLYSCSEYKKTCIRPGYGKILMNITNADTTNLSRVIPDPIQNATMICLPQLAGKDYERGITRSVSTAVYHCENAMVIADYRRKHSSSTIIYNLMNVNSGTVVGSSKLYNEFIIFEGRESIIGGNDIFNRFGFTKSDFHGKINLGRNSTNAFDFSQLKGDTLVVEADYDNMRGLQKIEARTNNSLWIAMEVVNNDLKLSRYHYVGRRGKADTFMCVSSFYHNSIVESGGGLSNSERDAIFHYKKAIISPYTDFVGRENDYTLYIKATGYKGKDLSSSINIYGTGAIIFPETDLLNDCNEIAYSSDNNTLSLKIGLDQDSQYTLDIKNYIARDRNESNFVLIDKNGSNIVPKIKKSGSSTAKINSFELHAEYSFGNFDAVEDHYREILNNSKGYEVFSVVRDKAQNWSNSTVPHIMFGSSGNDVINFDHGAIFARGGNGNDMYVIGNGIGEREVIIDNGSDDEKLDVLLIPEVPKEFLIRQHNLYLNYNDTRIQVKNYSQNSKYRHLRVMNSKKEAFVPYMQYTDSSVENGKLVPFFHATYTQDMFFLSKDFLYDHVVIDSRSEDIEQYRDKDDLLLIRENEVPFIVKIEGYYDDRSRWESVKFLLWNNGNFLYLNLPQEINEITNYQDKLKADCEKVVKEYVIDFSQSVSVIHNQSDALTSVKQDEERMGVIILKGVTPDQVEVSSSGSDLVLRDTKSNHTIDIKNWNNSESYRISTLEFDLGLDPIVIRRLNRFSLSNVVEIQTLINKASENYQNKATYSTGTEDDLKCLVSVNGFENRTYECLGFSSLQDQINFTENFCSLEQINKFKDKIPGSDQALPLLRKLQNDFLLNGYEQNTVDKCSELLTLDNLKYTKINAIDNNGETQSDKEFEEKRKKSAQRKRRHHHGSHHSSRKLLAIDSSNQLEIATNSGILSWVRKLATSTFESIISWLPTQYTGSIPDKNSGINIKDSTPKSISTVGWSDFLNSENAALASCIADALDNTPSKHYRDLVSKGAEVIPSIETAVRFGWEKFNSFVESKIKNLDSREQTRIRVEIKNAYPE